MGRWEPDARGRLAAAALELYGERGYEQTTVAEIARRAGLTERTFFRHYADKREVLFDGSDTLLRLFTDAVAGAPAGTAPLDAVAAALDAAAEFFTDRRDHSRRRQAVIAAHAELRERELIKLASIASALTEALMGRGVAQPAAALSAEAGVAVFKIGFERWVGAEEDAPMARLLRETLEALREIAGDELAE
ncbi:helix-turn-helix domain-containing protein [Streptomyces sp. NPDC003717]|uniref:TetR/AcrR family transcriptional regulator n=1 Tax=Streptomyces sp. NPDC003717 TaxID=3154276 RepID=UPI0033A416F1